jgi:hypothetical protein
MVNRPRSSFLVGFSSPAPLTHEMIEAALADD